jgi:hypothetical protein
MGDILTWVILLFIVSAFVFAVYLGAAPNSRLSRGLDAFWETPAIKQFGKFLRRTFWVLLIGMLAIGAIQDYFSRAGIREGAVENFLLVAGVIALAAGAALLALWGLVALVKFFWAHS